MVRKSSGQHIDFLVGGSRLRAEPAVGPVSGGPVGGGAGQRWAGRRWGRSAVVAAYRCRVLPEPAPSMASAWRRTGPSRRCRELAAEKALLRKVAMVS